MFDCISNFVNKRKKSSYLGYGFGLGKAGNRSTLLVMIFVNEQRWTNLTSIFSIIFQVFLTTERVIFVTSKAGLKLYLWWALMLGADL